GTPDRPGRAGADRTRGQPPRSRLILLSHPRRCPMADLCDGASVEMQGSGSRPYVLKNVGGVYSCSCPAWRNQSLGIERRTCKHLRKLRGDAAEEARIGLDLSPKPEAEGEDGAGAEKAGPPLLL